MCGIALVRSPEITEKHRAFFRSMMEAVSNRGEVSGTVQSGHTLAGVRRMKIQAPLGGEQPFWTRDKRHFILYNGEIFNFRELRDELKRGTTAGTGPRYDFASESDTEVALAAYMAWGRDCLPRFEGQFAFVIADTVTNEIFAARDPMGIIPLYYAAAGKDIYFSSVIRGLTGLGVPVRTLDPGSFLCAGEDGSLESKNYFHLETLFSQDRVSGQAVNIKQAIHDAVACRAITDHAIGVLYSGGLDSSIILHETHKIRPDVTAYTIGEPGCEDFVYAQRFCRERGIRHSVINLSRAQLDRRFIRETVRICESAEYLDIINAAVSIPVFRQIAREGTRVVLCGDGSDELFGGYDMYRKIPPARARGLFLHRLSDLHCTELQRVDRASMEYMVEARVPFLDTRVIKSALALPLESKTRADMEKTRLRELYRDELPPYIIQRHKNPFSHSSGIHEWVRQYKFLFRKYYNEFGYDLCRPIRKDFAVVLVQHGYDLDQALKPENLDRDYSRPQLWREFLKAKFRIWKSRAGK